MTAAGGTARRRVVILRGHSANPWELGTWELLADRFDVRVAVTGSTPYDLSGLALEQVRAPTVRDLLPRGRLGDVAALALGDRYRNLEQLLRGADIVHAAELGVWWSGRPAALKRELGFRLVLTVWETIPLRTTYRRFRGRADRERSLAETDLYLAATERARHALLLEGAPGRRILVCPPGVDVERFRSVAAAPAAQTEHVLVSPGRLVWEKGHYDVLRALAVLGPGVRAELVGAGPERERLLRYASDLGVGDRVTVHPLPYERMPEVFARASAVVLASLPVPLWEEQFGMVLAEALAAGAPIVASTSGAIPEVLAGSGAALFAPGDWPELARLLREGPLAQPPGARAAYPPELVERYSTRAAAERLASAYERVLAGTGP